MVDHTTSLSFQELCSVYHLDSHACHPASNSSSQSKRCRTQPNCLHGLRAKKSLLEQSQSSTQSLPPSVAKALGDDPSKRRRSKGSLVGLRNLGATCYMNALLQCLFMNSHFRHTLYQFRSSGVGETDMTTDNDSSNPDIIVLQLQRLFGLMEYGDESFIDPEPITVSLGLNKYQQQDINEFNHLFLSHLEQRLTKCRTEQIVRTLIASEFMGETVSGVKCRFCGQTSERSSSFLDLSLLIKGKKTVLECLQSMTEAEPLLGSNRYWCSFCLAKRDADRRTQLKRLPPVLNLQLIRFDYDKDNGQKKKLLDRIFIPNKLDMNEFLASSSLSQGDGAKYELTAVLRHKGHSAHRGHYTAEIRDARGKWWIFDDEKVALAGDQFNAKGDAAVPRVASVSDASKESGTASDLRKKKRRRKQALLTFKKKSAARQSPPLSTKSIDAYMQPQSKKPKTQPMLIDLEISDEDHPLMTDTHSNSAVIDISIDNIDSDGDIGTVSDSGDGASESVTDLTELKSSEGDELELKDGDHSSNAYMLVYTVCSRVEADRQKLAEAQSERPSRSPSSFICDFSTDCRLPPAVVEMIRNRAKLLSHESDEYQMRKTELVSRIAHRRSLVDQFIGCADAEPIQAHTTLSDPFCFVHTAWLQRWLNGLTSANHSDESVAKSVINASNDRQEIVLDNDEDLQAAIIASQQTAEMRESMQVISVDSEDDCTISSNATSTTHSGSGGTSPTHSSSQSLASSLIDPLWPGDIYESLNKLRCPHGKLDPRSSVLAVTKRLSREAWTILVNDVEQSEIDWKERQWKLGIAPAPLTSLPADKREPLMDDKALCDVCAKTLTRESEDLQHHRERFEEIAERMRDFTSVSGRSNEAFTSGELAESGYLVEREWWRSLSEAVKKMKLKSNSSVKITPAVSENINQALKCEHGSWIDAPHSRSILVSESMWHALLDLYPQSEGLRNRDPVCELCEKQSDHNATIKQALSEDICSEHERFPALKAFVRAKHDSFPDEKRAPLRRKDNRLYLLPAKWVIKHFLPYQEQIDVVEGNPIIEKPQPVRVRESLLCQHQQLKYNPRPVNSVTDCELPGLASGIVTVCEAAQWQALCGLNYATASDCVVMTVKSNVAESFGVGGDWSQIKLSVDPAVCVACLSKEQSDAHQRKFVYAGGRGSITVQRVDFTTPLTVTLASTDSGTGTTDRSSRRNRKVPVRETLHVSGLNADDDIRLVKMKISQYCNHNPASMVLYYEGNELEDNKCLLDYRVPNNGEVYLKLDANRCDDQDFLDFLPMEPDKFGDVEQGFKGTKLTTDVAAKASSLVPASSVPVLASPLNVLPTSPLSSGWTAPPPNIGSPPILPPMLPPIAISSSKLIVPRATADTTELSASPPQVVRTSPPPMTTNGETTMPYTPSSGPSSPTDRRSSPLPSTHRQSVLQLEPEAESATREAQLASVSSLADHLASSRPEDESRLDDDDAKSEQLARVLQAEAAAHARQRKREEEASLRLARELEREEQNQQRQHYELIPQSTSFSQDELQMVQLYEQHDNEDDVDVSDFSVDEHGGKTKRAAARGRLHRGRSRAKQRN